MSNSYYKINADPSSDTLIIAFTGSKYAKIFVGNARFEFVNFLNTNFNTISKHFYTDMNSCVYHKGILGLSKTIDETVSYLQNEIAPYKKVIFLGNSGGGYAAILFGSLLNITSVVAFMPPTLLRGNCLYYDEKYRDLNNTINNTTNYYIYGDMSITNELDCHHISHCERLPQQSNVFIIKKERINLREMRDSGELYQIISPLV